MDVSQIDRPETEQGFLRPRKSWKRGNAFGWLRPWLFVAPALGIYIAVVVYPMVFSVYLSFFRWDGISPKRAFVGLQNYLTLLTNSDVFWIALKNNAIFLIAALLLPTSIGLGLAVILNSKFASEGAEFIIAEALKEDPRPLFIAFLGPLTDMASALLVEPKIAERNVIVVWIGGGDWPVGSSEFNLSNDINAANVVFRSKVQVWQIPSPVYKRMAVSYAELAEKVYDKGAIGKYLVEQLVEWNTANVAGPIEHRSLGDSPAIGVMMYPDCGLFEWRPAPEFNAEMNYVHTGRNRPVRVYESVDQRFIHEDFFAKLARFHRS
jgi:hypothetical protein